MVLGPIKSSEESKATELQIRYLPTTENLELEGPGNYVIATWNDEDLTKSFITLSEVIFIKIILI